MTDVKSTGITKEDHIEITGIAMKQMALTTKKMTTMIDMSVVGDETIETETENVIIMADIMMIGTIDQRNTIVMEEMTEVNRQSRRTFFFCILANCNAYVSTQYQYLDRYRGRDDFEHMNASRRDRKKDRSTNASERGDYPSGYYQLPMNQFGYDPYSSYYQNQQYYENLRVTNPVAYAEWYNRYFANQLNAAASSVAAAAAAARERDGKESGRESVHSGRSSTKDNDR